MITVLGASGNTGGQIAKALLAAGEKVRAVARSKEKLAALAGAEIATGDVGDARFLASVFRGADAVYALIPPDPGAPNFRAVQDRVGEAQLAAFREAKVPRVVFLSSIGADLPSGTGPIAGLHAQEQRLRGLDGTQVLMLRPAYFMENLFASIPAVKHQGVNAGAIGPSVKMGMIATSDIAAVAAEALRKRDFQGFTVRELLGQRDVTNEEVTRILGAKIGKPDLAYVQVPYDAFAQALTGFGLSADVARLYAEMARAFNEGRIQSVEGRGPRNTTPTSIEQFAEVWAGAYRAG